MTTATAFPVHPDSLSILGDIALATLRDEHFDLARLCRDGIGVTEEELFSNPLDPASKAEVYRHMLDPVTDIPPPASMLTRADGAFGLLYPGMSHEFKGKSETAKS